MSHTIMGEIVATQITKYGNTNTKYGYVTLETEENNQVKLKVDAYTNHETLSRGEEVTIHYDTLGDSEIAVARKIVKN